MSTMADNVIERTAKHVRSRFVREGSGHDWFHTQRVWKLAKFLQSQEGGNLELIELGALLHCAAEHDFKNRQDDQARIYALEGILDVLDINEALQPQIITIAQVCKFRGRDTLRPNTLEGKIVQDANFLDTLGAIGVARGFAAGGYIGRVIHDPENKPNVGVRKDQYYKRKKEGTSINYFYEKPLQLLPFINTPTAKRIAAQRLKFTTAFLEQFEQEWQMEDVGDSKKIKSNKNG